MLRWGGTGCQGEPWCGVASRTPEANLHVPVCVLHVCVCELKSVVFVLGALKKSYPGAANLS